jgi:3-hydroxymyristoyl/3-hydroxydecanoyl-(acyl carrier protein) dehydratase
VPTAAGREPFGVGGRRALAKALAEHLEPDFDRVLLPRAWRVVESLPHDAQGKTAAERLLALFDDADTRPAALELLALRREPGSLDARLRVPEDLAFLEGHYPGHPVVAGVVQVHFVLRALEDWLEAPPRLERLEALKFRELLLPGQELRLRLDRDADGAGFAFTFSDPERPGRVFSSGRGRLRDDP